MKYLQKFDEKFSISKKNNQEYKLITLYKRNIKKLNLDSSIFGVKTFTIIGIHQLTKTLLDIDQQNLSDEVILSVIIYCILNIEKNLDIKNRLSLELKKVPNFENLVKKISRLIKTLITIINMVFKKDQIVIGSLKKMLNIKTTLIIKIFKLMGDFCIEHNLGLQKFTYIIHEKPYKVLKNIVQFIDKETSKDRYYIEGLLPDKNVTESVTYNFKNNSQLQRYKPILDEINNAKVGDILSNNTVYKFVQFLTNQAGKYDDCFIDGDLGDRLDKYDRYVLKEIPLNKINTDEWEWDETDVDEYKETYIKTKEYPPIVVNKKFSIIDGTHRANVLKLAGEEKILALVGL